LVDTYGIRDSDLVYYILFAVVIVPTQMAMDVFIQDSQELFHGWKIYEYLRYAQQRFINRTERWKLCEKEQDESIDKNLRAVDQLCFSTQFYFINALHAMGIVFVVFAVEMMILASYNMFADPMLPALVLYMIVVVRIIKLFCLKVADLMGLWMVIKTTEDIERTSLAHSLRQGSSAGSGSKAGSRSSRSKAGGGSGGITERMKSPDLMHAFLEHNRPWMLQNLANILTSEFLARNPPWLVKQIAKVLGVSPGQYGPEPELVDEIGRTKTTVAADISSDDGSDAGAELADYGNMDHLLTNAVHRVAMRWLSFVRVAEKKNAYDISTDSESEPEVDYEPAVITDAVRDIAEVWLRKVAKLLRAERQRDRDTFYADISSDSETGSDGDFGVMEHVQERTVEIAMRWLSKIRAPPPAMVGGLRVDISSDDSDDEDEPAIEYNFEAPVMSSKVTTIAFRWLRSIRTRLHGDKPKVMRDDISSDSSGDDEPEGMGGQKYLSSDEDSDGAAAGADLAELQQPQVKAVAYKWLRRVRRAETKSAWETETDIVEDVSPKKRLERSKPQRK